MIPSINVETVWSDKISVLLQTAYDNVCRTETRTEYKTEYDQKCETSYETKCETMYETVYEEVCDQAAPSVDEYGSPAAPVVDTYGELSSSIIWTWITKHRPLQDPLKQRPSSRTVTAAQRLPQFR